MSLAGRVLVTGATGALGGAVVERLLVGGSRVAVSYRSAPDWEALQERHGRSAALAGFEADIARGDGAAAFVERAAAALGGIDGVALVAGAWAGGASFHESAPDELARMLSVNLATAAYVCHAALPRITAPGGSIVAVGSLAARDAGGGMAAYAVAKSALHALVRVLALENRARGVRVNAVLPGTIDTPDNRAAMPDADRSRWTSPAAIAGTIAFLLSSESLPVSGALVPVDAPA
jgi:NAD(P)-dependent dehydrogenase (short-subunit alcohol dehydrogenase family)